MVKFEKVKVEVFKSIMEAFLVKQQGMVDDPVVVSGMMYICKGVHDSVTAQTYVDELRQICKLAIGFISRVSFGK